ncbi:MAG: LysM peptidoglycan-binding domain-containing protein [Candidatus Kapabacteria bacterium]|nr:LysM peptidoglycan-binding domain-containing protein [Candidatus Kapabacteria bacterium]MCX7936288.1 LysM peptidoglycan-binding domain-containing protein [Chlorobiota bacterium]
MYRILSFILMPFAAMLIMSCGSSQVVRAPESKPDSLLTYDEAILRLDDWRMRIRKLEDDEQKIQGEIKLMEERLNAAVADLKRCQDENNRLIGATDAQINQFRERLGRLEGRIRELRGLSDNEFEPRRGEVYALAAEWNRLRNEKIAVLPEFFDRMITARRDIQSLLDRKPAAKNKYVVRPWSESRDCLWNIAGNTEVYGDPFLWPKIWQANTDLIRNPDIIQPGWELSVPPKGELTPEEKRAERRYWRKKREAMAAQEQSQPTTSPSPPPSTGEQSERGERKP